MFCNAGGVDYLDSWALRRRFYNALERAGLPRVRFHDLRHLFGSLAITVLDPYAVQSYLAPALFRRRSGTCTTSRGERMRCGYRRPLTPRTSPRISPEPR